CMLVLLAHRIRSPKRLVHGRLSLRSPEQRQAQRTCFPIVSSPIASNRHQTARPAISPFGSTEEMAGFSLRQLSVRAEAFFLCLNLSVEILLGRLPLVFGHTDAPVA